MTLRSWNEIVTNTGKFNLKAVEAEGAAAGEYRIFPCQVPGADPNALWATDDSSQTCVDFDFVESNGGQLHLRDQSTSMLVSVSGDVVTTDSVNGTPLVPDEYGGNVVLRFSGGTGQPDRFLAVGPGEEFEGLGTLYPVKASLDPAAASSQWELDEVEGPTTVLDRWLYTYMPENRFSANQFMLHVQGVIDQTDTNHDDPIYTDGMLEGQADAITDKCTWWSGQFSATSALDRAEANGVMLLASAKFYNHPTSEFNDLDPEVPPDWTGIDDELGGAPYPG